MNIALVRKLTLISRPLSLLGRLPKNTDCDRIGKEEEAVFYSILLLTSLRWNLARQGVLSVLMTQQNSARQSGARLENTLRNAYGSFVVCMRFPRITQQRIDQRVMIYIVKRKCGNQFGKISLFSLFCGGVRSLKSLSNFKRVIWLRQSINHGGIFWAMWITWPLFLLIFFNYKYITTSITSLLGFLVETEYHTQDEQSFYTVFSIFRPLADWRRDFCWSSRRKNPREQNWNGAAEEEETERSNTNFCLRLILSRIRW